MSARRPHALSPSGGAGRGGAGLRWLRRGAAVPTALLLMLAVTPASAGVHLVAAADPALASMVLLGLGPRQPVLLFEAQDAPVIERFHQAYPGPAACLWRAATPAALRPLLEAAAGAACTPADDLVALARRLWPAPPAVVLVAADDYPGLLRGAALAGALNAALLPITAATPPSVDALTEWHVPTWYAVGDLLAPPLPADAALTRLADADSVAAATVRAVGGTAGTVVVANPSDRRGRFSPSGLSLLAPLIAVQHRAPLVLVSAAAATTVESEVQRAIVAGGLAPTHIYLVGDELALRSHRVADPVLAAGGPEALGGARDVRVELFSQIQALHPQDYAVGRFVAEDAARASISLARQQHDPDPASGPVVMLSNADAVFALGETISRTTVSELRNAGLPVRAAFRDAVTPAAIRSGLEEAGLLVWEGHARDLTLEERGGVTVARTPPLVVLQGCYTLDRSDPFILFEHGTNAIVATSAAIYSASGSAFARALLDSLVYDDADLGTAVRNARNFLLAVTELKKRRGHRDWAKTYRAALAFALWGDPTLRPPLARGTPRLAPTLWRKDAARLELTVPARRLKTARVGRYTAQPVPRAMLSGLILRQGDAPGRTVKELFFAAVQPPAGLTAACAPQGWEVVSLWAPDTYTLSVLARPPGDAPADLAKAGTFSFPLVANAAACP